MRKTCEVCGVAFDAKRQSARYCSDRCRVRASRRRGASSTPVTDADPLRDTAETSISTPRGSVFAATRTELEAAGRAESAVGVAVLALALRIDGAASAETGAGLAALVKEFRATLESALADAEPAADPLDELRERRERRFNAG